MELSLNVGIEASNFWGLISGNGTLMICCCYWRQRVCGGSQSGSCGIVTGALQELVPVKSSCCRAENSALSKIAEAVILNRIEDAIEDQLIPYQFGFRENLSKVQQLLRITEFVREGMDEGWDTGTVFLDIAKAFDRVWTDGLLHKLIVMRIPSSIIRLMATYLRGRRFAVRVGSSLSSERAIVAEVVQGSKIGPKMFNIYINDIPIPRNCQTRLCLFADDNAIMNTGASNNITENLNSYLDQLGKFLIGWKKSTLTSAKQCIFHVVKQLPSHQNFTAEQSHGATAQSIVILDKRLTFRNHIENNKQKVNAIKATLYLLISRK
ncbi:putative RNA-directed DNA polymerase from transposon BS [Araneus ventricosus]|uniref:Putative RNA-directed DNA polymerase from transposon BS n=1 Tax=Araneus ventricosus TaxID=182803 RepID=A0A4Y2QHK1_ARAVE|nr:putative RNA-directed DNA polymerase from transposon BS [Araneus ventricosus]